MPLKIKGVRSSVRWVATPRDLRYEQKIFSEDELTQQMQNLAISRRFQQSLHFPLRSFTTKNKKFEKIARNLLRLATIYDVG
jgi:hypothetical protein